MKEIYKDLGYTVVYERDAAHVDFKAYSIVGHEAGLLGLYDVPMYEKIGWQSSSDTTTNLEEAQTEINGTVKWDGCSHYHFGDKDGYIHVCGGHYAENLSKLIKKIFCRCGEIGKFDYEDFDICKEVTKPTIKS
jgi:hypothetical protein